MRLKIAAALMMVLVPGMAGGHGGGLDRNGCHTERSTGRYHCHGSGSSSPRPAPAPRATPRSTPAPRSPAPAVPSTSSSAIQPFTSSGAVPSVAAVAATPRELILTAQTLLVGLAYRVPRDGVLGADTATALRTFQRSQGLPEDGLVSGAVLVQLAEVARRRMP